MHFDGKDDLKIANVMTADNCQNIMAALQYVTEKTKALSPKGLHLVQSYIHEQVAQWAEQSNGKLTEQDIMYGLIRSHVILQNKENEVCPVDVRYAVEHPMRISQMRYGVCADDEKAPYRIALLLDMLFDNNGKPIYDTQRLFLSSLADKLIQDDQTDNQTDNQTVRAMVNVLLNGMKRSANTSDSWSVFSLNMKPEAVCCIGTEQTMMPRLVASNRLALDEKTAKRERD
jgi:hypothetical protein